MFNLRFRLAGIAAAVGLLGSAACTSQPPERAETTATQVETPRPPAPTSGPVGETPAADDTASAGHIDPAALADFLKRVAVYVAVHQKADGQVPSLKRTDEPKEISSREAALGDAIRALRSDARPGDIMAPAIADEFRRLIKKDLAGRSPQERKNFLDEIPSFRQEINLVYPSKWPLATFPATLLEVMPKLPEILEYRLLKEALILRDAKANTIADFILDVY